jgi:hypothetical protein
MPPGYGDELVRGVKFPDAEALFDEGDGAASSGTVIDRNPWGRMSPATGRIKVSNTATLHAHRVGRPMRYNARSTPHPATQSAKPVTMQYTIHAAIMIRAPGAAP